MSSDRVRPVVVVTPAATAKHNRPLYTRFRQQQLPVWQPLLTASSIVPAFCITGLLFIPIGVALLYVSSTVVEHSIDYTHCESDDYGTSCFVLLQNASHVGPAIPACHCTIHFQLTQHMLGDVYFYYGLTNFYQNHRRYVKSRSDKQLQGDWDDTGNCDPFDRGSQGRVVVPCGAVANSIFNDTFVILADWPDLVQPQPVPLTTDQVAWAVDTQVKFNNPQPLSELERYAKPVHWPQPASQLEGGLQNVDLMVWMRTAALPHFTKLWRRLDRKRQPFASGLPKGNYTLLVDYRYPVHTFAGTKRLIVTTVSWLGGRNEFLAVGYLVVGCLCLLLGAAAALIHCRFNTNLDRAAGQNRRS